MVREYVGTGPLAELVADMDAAERSRREAQALAWRAERAQLERLDGEIRDVCALADALATSALLLAGYRRHHRGEWRLRREKRDAAGG